MNSEKKWLDGVALAEATGLSVWVVYGIKKANRLKSEQGLEDLIFTGRLSTPERINHWLATHPDFVARQVLVKPKSAEPGSSAPQTHQPRQPVAA